MEFLGILEKFGDKGISKDLLAIVLKDECGSIDDIIKKFKKDHLIFGTNIAGGIVYFLTTKGKVIIKENSLVKALKSPENATRLPAVKKLGEMKSRDAVPALIQLLGIEDQLLRETVLDALGKIKDPAAVHSLAHFLKSSDQELEKPENKQFTFALVRTLGAFGIEEAANVLIDELNKSLEGCPIDQSSTKWEYCQLLYKTMVENLPLWRPLVGPPEFLSQKYKKIESEIEDTKRIRERKNQKWENEEREIKLGVEYDR